MTDTSPDAMVALADLLTLMTKPAAYKAKLEELQQQIDTAAKAQAKLDADRAAHEQKIAADGAELAAREAKVADRLFRAMRLEREPPVDPVDLDDQFPHNPNLLPGTQSRGLARHKGDE